MRNSFREGGRVVNAKIHDAMEGCSFLHDVEAEEPVGDSKVSEFHGFKVGSPGVAALSFDRRLH